VTTPPPRQVPLPSMTRSTSARPDQGSAAPRILGPVGRRHERRQDGTSVSSAAARRVPPGRAAAGPVREQAHDEPALEAAGSPRPRWARSAHHTDGSSNEDAAGQACRRRGFSGAAAARRIGRRWSALVGASALRAITSPRSPPGASPGPQLTTRPRRPATDVAVDHGGPAPPTPTRCGRRRPASPSGTRRFLQQHDGPGRQGRHPGGTSSIVGAIMAGHIGLPGVSSCDRAASARPHGRETP
jgi:hypothetical protein